MATITLQATWKSTHTIEVPEGVDPHEFAYRINHGDDEALDAMGEFTSATSDLVGWEASV